VQRGSLDRLADSELVRAAPFENTHLVSEHHDLDVPLQLGPSARHNEAEDATQAEVDEREEHTG
jgi:hypothetical protein